MNKELYYLLYTGKDVATPDTKNLNNLFELETGRNYATFFGSDFMDEGVQNVTSDHSLSSFFKVLSK